MYMVSYTPGAWVSYEDPNDWMIFNLVMDTLFIFDIVLNFFTVRQDKIGPISPINTRTYISYPKYPCTHTPKGISTARGPTPRVWPEKHRQKLFIGMVRPERVLIEFCFSPKKLYTNRIFCLALLLDR